MDRSKSEYVSNCRILLRRLCINVRTWFLLDPLERVPLCYRRQHLKRGGCMSTGQNSKFLGTYIQMLVLQLALSLKGYPWIYWFIIFVIKITIVVFPMYPSLDKPNCWDTPQNHQHLLQSLGRPSAFSSQVHNIVTLLSGTAFIKTSKWLLKPPVPKYIGHWRITGNNLAENYNYPNMLMFSIIIPSK